MKIDQNRTEKAAIPTGILRQPPVVATETPEKRNTKINQNSFTSAPGTTKTLQISHKIKSHFNFAKTLERETSARGCREREIAERAEFNP